MIREQFKICALDDLVDYRFAEYVEVCDGEVQVKLVSALPVDFQRAFVPRYLFDIVLMETGCRLGFILFRVALTDGLAERGGHLGFEIEELNKGNNYAAKAIVLLKPFMRKHSSTSILITCDEENIASRKTIERAGGELVAIKKNDNRRDCNLQVNCCYYTLRT